MNFLKQAFNSIRYPTHKRTLGFLGILTFVGIISLTVAVAQQQQQTRQRAAEKAVCSTIDSVPECESYPGGSCSSQGARCKIDQTIYECSQGSLGGGGTED